MRHDTVFIKRMIVLSVSVVRDGFRSRDTVHVFYKVSQVKSFQHISLAEVDAFLCNCTIKINRAVCKVDKNLELPDNNSHTKNGSFLFQVGEHKGNS